MITEEDIHKAIFKAVNENKIPYTEDGLNTLLDLVQKEFGPERSYEIKVGPIEEMSAIDRAERKLPKITVSIK